MFDMILISLIPTGFMLLLGAIIYLSDPQVRADRRALRLERRARRQFRRDRITLA